MFGLDSKETAELKRWCASRFGDGPTEAGHHIQIKAFVLWALHSFLPPDTLNSLIHPKVSQDASIILLQMESHLASSFWITISVPMRATFMLC